MHLMKENAQIIHRRVDGAEQLDVLSSPGILLIANKENDGSEMYKQFMDMFEPQGVVDIALETGLKCNSTPFLRFS